MTPRFSDRIETLIQITSRLISLLDREVEMLREMRVPDIESLREEKNDLTLAYEQAVRVLAAEPGKLAAIEPALRETLTDVARRFDNSLAANANAIAAVRESQERLLKAVVDAAAEQRARQKAYTAKGSFEARHRSRRAPALSLTLDRRL